MSSTPKADKFGQECEEVRGSLRGTNKLARRARSFKDDLLERISAMRSPASHNHYIRSHSPLSPTARGTGRPSSNGNPTEADPLKELEQLVRQVQFDLKHFCDVIAKEKLEMLPGNGTIVLDTITSIQTATRGCGCDAASGRVCAALARLVRLCDDALLAGGSPCPALRQRHVQEVVQGVQEAVEELSQLARSRLSGRPALAPRAPLATHRNSLPDIPRVGERALCAGQRAHSSESVLDCDDEPPPKPPRPHRKTEVAPPLPPKKKPNDGSLTGLSAMDRTSPVSHSSGSLDSALNVTQDEEISAIMTDHTLAGCSCPRDQSPSNRVSLDSTSTNHTSSSASVSTNDASSITASHLGINHRLAFEDITNMGSNFTNHRLSNESGFVSMGAVASRSSEVSYSSYCSSSRSNTLMGFTEINRALHATNGVVELNKDAFQTEFRAISEAASTLHASEDGSGSGSGSVSFRDKGSCGECSSGGSPLPPALAPALPAKARARARAPAEFAGVEIRQHWCTLHGAGAGAAHARPHTLAAHAHLHPHAHTHPHPPPLPLKKKHMFQSVAYSVMAYMEMFGNCSHPPHASPAPDMFRHSIHTCNLSSGQQEVSSMMLGTSSELTTTSGVAQSHTLQHFSAHHVSVNSVSSGSSVSVSPPPFNSPAPPAPPVPPLPPKMNKIKLPLPAPSGRPSPSLRPHTPPSPKPPPPHPAHPPLSPQTTHNSCNSGESAGSPARFPLLEEDAPPSSPPPAPPAPPATPPSTPPADVLNGEAFLLFEDGGSVDILMENDTSAWLVLKTSEESGPDIQGGHPDALIVHATRPTKDFAYQEAFLATYRTFVSPAALVSRLARRAAALAPRRRPRARETHALLVRVVSDLMVTELDASLLRQILEFVYWLVRAEELAMAKALRIIILDKYRQLNQMKWSAWEAATPSSGNVASRRETLLDFRASEVAEQMTLLDATLFARISAPEVLAWTQYQREETSPNLTRFTEHFNKMSYWARSRILEQQEAKERERYLVKLAKVMRHLRKVCNFNSFLALLSAADSAPVRRLGWGRAADSLHHHCALIDSSGSFRAYRQALSEVQPPCIPYIGLVLQDLTFVHEGNVDQLPDGSINFSMRWQQYHIMENMKRFYKVQYTFKKNERILAMLNGFDDCLSEEAMWQISESIKPRTRPQPAPA